MANRGIKLRDINTGLPKFFRGKIDCLASLIGHVRGAVQAEFVGANTPVCAELRSTAIPAGVGTSQLIVLGIVRLDARRQHGKPDWSLSVGQSFHLLRGENLPYRHRLGIDQRGSAIDNDGLVRGPDLQSHIDAGMAIRKQNNTRVNCLVEPGDSNGYLIISGVQIPYFVVASIVGRHVYDHSGVRVPNGNGGIWNAGSGGIRDNTGYDALAGSGLRPSRVVESPKSTADVKDEHKFREKASFLIRWARPRVIISNVPPFEIVTLQLLSDWLSSQMGKSVSILNLQHSRTRNDSKQKVRYGSAVILINLLNLRSRNGGCQDFFWDAICANRKVECS